MQKKNVVAGSFRYQGLQIMMHPEVYDPAEDSFLLLEALQITPHETVLEIGTGCGLIALVYASKGAHVVCTDINPFAVQVTRHNKEQNRASLTGSLEVRQGDLFSVLDRDERFDVVVFNPPYLPTPKKEKPPSWQDVATNGGRDGLRVTKQFIHHVKHHLHPAGQAYFIFTTLSDRSTLEQYLNNEGFSYEVCARQRLEGERLEVYRIIPAD
jgi:release factor glutamine methyltransferase